MTPTAQAALRNQLKIASRVLLVLGMVCGLFAFRSVATYLHDNPSDPAPSEGRIYPLDQKGHVVYLNQSENEEIRLWQAGFVGFWLAGFACSAGMFYTRDKSQPMARSWFQ
jgi:hypothetical protein